MRDAVVARVVDVARRATGFDDAAVSRAAMGRLVDRVAATLGLPAILALCDAPTDAFLDDVVRACVVDETYLFRQPEHFAFVEEQLVPGWLARGRPIRAWSAGCATGEEAWSIASCLLEAVDGRVDVDVVGSDLVAAHVAAANDGVCKEVESVARAEARWRVVDPQTSRVRQSLRAVTRFVVKDVRSPAPARDLDLIFCRNVLLYFAADDAARALAALVDALADDGVLVTGPVDTAVVPAGVVAIGPAGLAVYRRAPVARVVVPTAPAPPATFSEAAAADVGAVDAHVRALHAVEDGDLDAALRHLSDAARRGYVPAIVERALLLERGGDGAAAASAMRDALARLAVRADTEIVDGPQPLPVLFWKTSARAFLDRHGARR